MKVLERATTPQGTEIQIEEWNENYKFMPYAATIASYPKSKVSHEGTWSPKANEQYRFSFNFKSAEETRSAFNDLITGTKTLSDLKAYMDNKKYANCI